MAAAARKKPLPVAQLIITFDDVEPKMARHVRVPYRICLDASHRVFQAPMNSHLCLIAARGISWGEAEPASADYDAAAVDEARLAEAVRQPLEAKAAASHADLATSLT